MKQCVDFLLENMPDLNDINNKISVQSVQKFYGMLNVFLKCFLVPTSVSKILCSCE